jgi:hypothetical protein
LSLKDRPTIGHPKASFKGESITGKDPARILHVLFPHESYTVSQFIAFTRELLGMTTKTGYDVPTGEGKALMLVVATILRVLITGKRGLIISSTNLTVGQLDKDVRWWAERLKFSRSACAASVVGGEKFLIADVVVATWKVLDELDKMRENPKLAPSAEGYLDTLFSVWHDEVGGLIPEQAVRLQGLFRDHQARGVCTATWTTALADAVGPSGIGFVEDMVLSGRTKPSPEMRFVVCDLNATIPMMLRLRRDGRTLIIVDSAADTKVCSAIVGEYRRVTKENRETVLAEFRNSTSSTPRILVITNGDMTGLDLRGFTTVLSFTMLDSWETVLQQAGRVGREGQPNTLYIHCVDFQNRTAMTYQRNVLDPRGLTVVRM